MKNQSIKIIKKNLHLLIVLLLSVIIMSCTNSYDQLINNFNHDFFTPERPEEDVYSVSSLDFDPDTMLDEYYTFKKGYYVNLEAPADAESYLWSYSDIVDTDNLIPLSHDRYLYLNTSETFNSNETSHSFKLVLTITVKEKEGTVKEYIDSSTITIIDQDKAGHGGC